MQRTVGSIRFTCGGAIVRHATDEENHWSRIVPKPRARNIERRPIADVKTEDPYVKVDLRCRSAGRIVTDQALALTFSLDFLARLRRLFRYTLARRSSMVPWKVLR